MEAPYLAPLVAFQVPSSVVAGDAAAAAALVAGMEAIAVLVVVVAALAEREPSWGFAHSSGDLPSSKDQSV